MNKNGRILFITAVITIAGVIFTFAYYTDHNTKNNIFTCGKVNISLTEPEFEKRENKGENKTMTPGKKIIKDPVITNTGLTDAYVFVKICLPVNNEIPIGADGEKTESKNNESILSFEVNSDWRCLRINTEQNNGIVTENYFVYYGNDMLKKVKPGEKVSPVKNNTFTVKNYLEGSGNNNRDIIIKAYAIQCDSLNISASEPLKVLEEIINEKNFKQ